MKAQVGPGGLAILTAPPAETTITEGFIASKTGRDTCEDALVICPSFLAVFDGMSDGGLGGNGRVRAAVRATIERLVELPDPTADAETVFGELTDAVHQTQAEGAGPFGVVGAIYSSAHREVWRVGDVHVRLRPIDSNDTWLPGGKDIDTVMTELRAAVNYAVLASGADQEEIREQDPGLAACRELLTRQNSLANTTGPFGYGVINGDPIPSQLIERFDLHAGTVILATDGYLSPLGSLADAEQELSTAMAADPLALEVLRSMGKCLQPQNIAPDDRTYLRFEIG